MVGVDLWSLYQQQVLGGELVLKPSSPKPPEKPKPGSKPSQSSGSNSRSPPISLVGGPLSIITSAVSALANALAHAAEQASKPSSPKPPERPKPSPPSRPATVSQPRNIIFEGWREPPVKVAKKITSTTSRLEEKQSTPRTLHTSSTTRRTSRPSRGETKTVTTLRPSPPSRPSVTSRPTVTLNKTTTTTETRPSSTTSKPSTLGKTKSTATVKPSTSKSKSSQPTFFNVLAKGIGTVVGTVTTAVKTIAKTTEQLAQAVLEHEIEKQRKQIAYELEVARYSRPFTRRLIETKEKVLEAAQQAAEKGNIVAAHELLKTAKALTPETATLAGGEEYLNVVEKTASVVSSALDKGKTSVITTPEGKAIIIREENKYVVVPLVSPKTVEKTTQQIIKGAQAAVSALPAPFRAVGALINAFVTPEVVKQQVYESALSKITEEAHKKISTELEQKAQSIWNRYLEEAKQLALRFYNAAASKYGHSDELWKLCLNLALQSLRDKYSKEFEKIGLRLVDVGVDFSTGEAYAKTEPTVQMEVVAPSAPASSLIEFVSQVRAPLEQAQRLIESYKRYYQELSRQVHDIVYRSTREELESFLKGLERQRRTFYKAGLYSVSQEIENVIEKVRSKFESLRREAEKTSQAEAVLAGLGAALAPTVKIISKAIKMSPFGKLAESLGNIPLTTFWTVKQAVELGERASDILEKWSLRKLQAIKLFRPDLKGWATAGASIGSVINVFQVVEAPLAFAKPEQLEKLGLKTTAELIELRRSLQPGFKVPILGEVKVEDIASVVVPAAAVGITGKAARVAARFAPRLSRALKAVSKGLEMYFSVAPEAAAIEGLRRGVVKLISKVKPRIGRLTIKLTKTVKKPEVEIEVPRVVIEPIKKTLFKPVLGAEGVTFLPEVRVVGARVKITKTKIKVPLSKQEVEKVLREVEKSLETLQVTEPVAELLRHKRVAVTYHGKSKRQLTLPEGEFTIEELKKLLPKDIISTLTKGEKVELPTVFTFEPRGKVSVGEVVLMLPLSGRPEIRTEPLKYVKEHIEAAGRVTERRTYIAEETGARSAGIASRRTVAIAHRAEERAIVIREGERKLGIAEFRGISIVPELPKAKIVKVEVRRVAGQEKPQFRVEIKTKIETPEELATYLSYKLATEVEKRDRKILYKGVPVVEIKPPEIKPKVSARQWEVVKTQNKIELKIGGILYTLAEKVSERGLTRVKAPRIFEASESELKIRLPSGEEAIVKVGREGVYLEIGEAKIPVSVRYREGLPRLVIGKVEVPLIPERSDILPTVMRLIRVAKAVTHKRYTIARLAREVEARPREEVKRPEVTVSERGKVEVEVKPREEAEVKKIVEVKLEVERPKVIDLTVRKVGEKRIVIGGVNFDVKKKDREVVLESELIRIENRQQLRQFYIFITKLEYILRTKLRLPVDIDVVPEGRRGVRVIVRLSHSAFSKIEEKALPEVKPPSVETELGESPAVKKRRREKEREKIHEEVKPLGETKEKTAVSTEQGAARRKPAGRYAKPTVATPTSSELRTEVEAKVSEEVEEKREVNGGTPAQVETEVPVPDISQIELALLGLLLALVPLPPPKLRLLLERIRRRRRPFKIEEVVLDVLKKIEESLPTVAPTVTRVLVI